MTPTSYVIQKAYGRYRILGYNEGVYETVLTFEDKYDTYLLAQTLVEVMRSSLAHVGAYRKQEEEKE